MKRTCLSLVAAAIFCAGCAGSAPLFTAVEAEIPEVQADKARLYFVRTRETRTYFVRRAPVWIDSERTGLASYGSVFYRDVSPGVHRIRTSTWDMPGQCRLTLVTHAGVTYFVEVAARVSSAAAYAGGDAAAAAAGASVWTSLASGVAAMAVESADRECAGPFRLTLLDKEDARDKLGKLRLIRQQTNR